MTATGPGPDSGDGGAGGFAGSPEHRYFQAVEEIFIRLRGAPLLLSAADWRVARRWHRRGIPLEVVRRALEEVFERRRERGAARPVQSLRYCAPAVEAAWSEIESLSAGGRTVAAPPVDVAARLASLAASLPSELPDRRRWEERIRSLAGETEAVEQALATLDGELLETLEASLDEADRQALAAGLESALAALSSRLPEDEVATARRRLLRQSLRRRWKLPLLSLFSPEAEAGDDERDPAGDLPG